MSTGTVASSVSRQLKPKVDSLGLRRRRRAYALLGERLGAAGLGDDGITTTVSA